MRRPYPLSISTVFILQIINDRKTEKHVKAISTAKKKAPDSVVWPPLPGIIWSTTCLTCPAESMKVKFTADIIKANKKSLLILAENMGTERDSSSGYSSKVVTSGVTSPPESF
jgi:hypothetical protein